MKLSMYMATSAIGQRPKWRWGPVHVTHVVDRYATRYRGVQLGGLRIVLSWIS